MALYERYAPDVSALNKRLEITVPTLLRGQAFTVGTTSTDEAHRLTQVTIRAYRVGKPGTVTVVVRATDMAGEPTGAVLAAGTFNGDTITTDTNGEAISVDMTPQIQLDAATQYCFYLSADFT